MLLCSACSDRDHANERVFSRLARGKRSASCKIGDLLGGVVQDCAEESFKYAPHVGSVGSASYAALSSRLLHRVEAGQSQAVGLAADNDQTFDASHVKRDRPYSTYLSLAIFEGRVRFCTYCVAPWKFTD